MKELQVIQYGDIEAVDSREVALLVGKRHNDLLRDIRCYIEIMDKSGERKIAHSDFFIESSYRSEQNKEMPCYLLTKKGCDMVANKMTGEKGVLFTAAYVTAFEKMREHIQGGVSGGAGNAALDEAKLNNSRTRLAAEWLKIADRVPVQEYKDICIHYASTALAGREVLPLPKVREKTYAAGEVGKMLGGISANMVGRMANQHGLKTPEYGVEVWDKSPYSTKQVPAWRYNERAVERLRELVSDLSDTAS